MSRRIIIVALAVGATVFSAIAISQAAATSGGQRTKHAASRKTHAGANVLYARFSILRSAQASASSADSLPIATAEDLTAPGTMVSEYEIEPANARYVEDNGTAAWIVPGAKGLCLTVPAADGNSISTGCGSLATATTGILQVHRPSSSSAPVVVDGLVPNGDSVSVTNQDGSHSSISVPGNFFTYSSSSAQAVAIDTPGGSAVETVTLAKP